MKRSALKEFIKGEILATLTEASAEDVNNQKDLNKELEKTAAISKELGLEENGKKDHWADYTDIGMFYLEAHGNMYQGKEQKLTDSQYEELGKKIVDQLYDGDVSKAYDETYKAVKGNELKYKGSLKEGNFDELKKYQKMLSDAADFYRKKAEELGVGDIGAFNKGINDLETAIFDEDNKRSGGKIDENEDTEPTKKDIKKTKGLAKAKEELALLTREMKSLAKEYSKAEGEEKEKLVKTLKEKTKLKKELESILDNKKI